MKSKKGWAIYPAKTLLIVLMGVSTFKTNNDIKCLAILIIFKPKTLGISGMATQSKNDIIPIIGMASFNRMSDNLESRRINLTDEQLQFLHSTF